MGKVDVYHHQFATGVVDKDVLPRTDLAVMQLAAEQQTNLMCLATGRGFFRPGTAYLGSTAAQARSRLLAFVFGASDACLLEFSNAAMRVWVNDALVVRPAVSSAVTNGDFASAAGWTDGSTAGATASVSGGLLNLTALGRGSLAMFKQLVATATPGVEHALRIVVSRGPVTFRCGSTNGGDEYVEETQLRTGVHSLAFTPVTSFWVQIQSDTPVLRQVDSITVEAAGVVSLPTPWMIGDLPLLRTEQSADVVFAACRGKMQRRIERRGIRGQGRSWSVVSYLPDNGPFTPGRTASVRLQPSVVEGNGTLSADKPFFKAAHVGALFKLSHTGQRIGQYLSGEDQFTDPIEVTGINNLNDSDASLRYNDRNWFWTVSGTWSGTLNVFRSFDGPDFGYNKYRKQRGSADQDITSNESQENDDVDNNAKIWYRIGFGQGGYVSGSAQVLLDYEGGGGYGICRVTGYSSPTSVSIEILKPFKGTTYTDDWQEGSWSDLRGYPSAIGLYEGRLWWAGADQFWGSVSDDFENFDEETDGDAGPISRVITTNGVNDTQWMLPLQRLILGTDGSETPARSSSFDEPLSPTNTSLKDASTIGAAPLSPVRVDGRGIFVDRSGQSLFELSISSEDGDYASDEITDLVKSLFSAAVSGLVVQRRPNTRIWCWLETGMVVCIVYEPKKKVMAFIPVETDGAVESIAVLPSIAQDLVYCVVNRTVNGSTVRYVEKLALDIESRPGTLCKVMDSHIIFTNAPASATVEGLGHLIGKTVRAWVDGAPVTEIVNGQEVAKDFVVSEAGRITLPSAATTGVVGIPYSWRYKSARLAYGATGGTAMLQKKRVDELGMIMTDFVRAGIRYGRKFDDPNHPLSPLPVLKDGVVAPAIVTGAVDDEEPLVFPGDWNLDSRVCIEGESPFPASLLGLVLAVTTNG